jgi:hypothetical protein
MKSKLIRYFLVIDFDKLLAVHAADPKAVAQAYPANIEKRGPTAGIVGLLILNELGLIEALSAKLTRAQSAGVSHLKDGECGKLAASIELIEQVIVEFENAKEG